MDFDCENNVCKINDVPSMTEEELSSADLSHNVDFIERVLRFTELATDGTLVLDRESGRRVSDTFCKG